MPGYIIHISVANEYMRKNPNEIKDYSKYIDGVIFPDSVEDKSLTHYGEKSSKVNLKKFLEENEIEDDDNKGYFMHLVTDYLFYNKFLDCFSKDIYNDYDILNLKLQERFNIKLPNMIRDKVFYKDGETKILELDSVLKFIDDTSNYKLNNIREMVLDNDKEWTEFKVLRKL